MNQHLTDNPEFTDEFVGVYKFNKVGTLHRWINVNRCFYITKCGGSYSHKDDIQPSKEGIKKCRRCFPVKDNES